MNDEPDPFQSPKAKSGYSPRPIKLIIPPGQEVKIELGEEFRIVFENGSTVRRAAGGGPRDTATPKSGG